MQEPTSPLKNPQVLLDHHACPLVARIKTLETELAYYKAICSAYETGKLKAQGSHRRLTIQKNSSRDLDKLLPPPPQTFELQGYKDEQIKFSENIDRKIKKGVSKKPDNSQEIRLGLPLNDSHVEIHDSQSSSKPEAHRTRHKELSKSQFDVEAPPLFPLPPSEEFLKKQASHEQQKSEVKEGDKSSEEPEVISEVADPLPSIKVMQEESKSEQQQKSIKPSVPLISDLCLFGCSDKEMQNLSNEKLNEVQPHLVFSMFQLNSNMYYDQVAKYLFPNGLYSRRMRTEKLLSEVNQILLQNVKKHSNFIYELKSDLKFDSISKEESELLRLVNPNLNLYCVSIKINDFTIVDPDAFSDKEKSPEKSFHSNDKDEQGVNSNRSANYMPKKRRQSKDIKHYSVLSNKKVVSIFTYYPFFEFFESFLISIFNALKIEKLGIYQNRLETIFKIDSKYAVHQLATAYTQMVSQINTTMMSLRLDYEFILGVDLIKISTDGINLTDACLGAWVYPVLRLFDKNTFYETLMAILFEEQVIFVCDNQHMLSYAIYLFTEVLVRPFHYQHSTVYMVSEWDLLDAPTPIVLGVNKSSEWLNETPLHQGHLYVQLGEDAVLVDKRKKVEKVRSEKLKKIISNFFKSIDRDGITLFKEKKKRDGVEYSMSASAKEKEQCISFISWINVFMKHELVDLIPSTHFIEGVKERFRWSNKIHNQDAATVISEEILAQMLNVRKEKDPFVEKFMRTQIFLTYLFDIVKLQE